MDDVLVGQRCVLLVTVTDEREDEAAEAWPVTISATSPGGSVHVEPEAIVPGQVAEVTVIPEHHPDDPAGGEEGWTVTATVTAERDGHRQTADVPLTIWSLEEDLVEPLAVDMRAKFIPLLAADYPDLGIDENTEWTPTIVTLHNLVVTHYLFFSDEWEMHIYWHNMIPPYDWAVVDLRRRFQETRYSVAFDLAHWQSDEPQELTQTVPEDDLWR